MRGNTTRDLIHQHRAQTAVMLPAIPIRGHAVNASRFHSMKHRMALGRIAN
jgi:hypothetical protein